MVNDDNQNLDPQGLPEPLQPPSGEQAESEQTSESGSTESEPQGNPLPPERHLPASPVVEAADFLGLDDELAKGSSASPGSEALPAGSASSWLFEDNPDIEGAQGAAPAAGSEAGGSVPPMPTGGIEGSWLMSSDGLDEAKPIAATPQPAEAEVAEDAPVAEQAAPQSWLLDPSRTKSDGAASNPRAAAEQAADGAGPDSENWLLDLDESQDDGTRPVGPAGEIDTPQVAGLDASYYEPPPATDAVKSFAPKILLATCLGVLAVAGYKFTQGVGNGEFEPVKQDPVAVEHSLQKGATELEGLSSVDRGSEGGNGSDRTATNTKPDFKADLDRAQDGYSRMRQPWIRQGARTHKEPGELDALGEDYPVAGSIGATTIFIFPPPAPVSEAVATLGHLNELTRGGRATISGAELRLALSEYPGFRPIQAGKSTQPELAPNPLESDGPATSRLLGPQWGSYMAQMHDELASGAGAQLRLLGPVLADAPNADRIAQFGPRAEDSEAAFPALGFVPPTTGEALDGAVAALEKAGIFSPNWQANLSESSTDSAGVAPEPGAEPVTGADLSNGFLALMAISHGFEENPIYFEQPEIADGDPTLAEYSFPPRAVPPFGEDRFAAVVITGEASGRSPYSTGGNVGPPLETFMGRGALLARLLPLERSPLDQYFEWRRERAQSEPIFEYVATLGQSSAVPPTGQLPYLEATIATAETYVSSLGPYPTTPIVITAPPIEPTVAVVEPTTGIAPPSIPKGVFGMPKLTPSTLRRADPRDRWLKESIPRHAISASSPLKTPRVGRVRAIFDSGEVLEGRLWAVGQDRIWVETEIGRLSLEARKVSKLERMVGDDAGEMFGERSVAGLPKMRVWVPGGVILGYQVSRDGDEIVLLTDEGRMKLTSDRIELAVARRTTVARKER